MNTINENIIQKVNYGLFLVLVFSLSVFHKWVPILIILWGLSWFFDGGINRLRVSIRNRNNFILLSIFFLFFLLHIIGLFYTSPDNLNRGLASIEKNIYLLIIPLFILSANKYYQKEQVFVSFILGCFISFLWILFIAFKNSGEEETLLNNIKNVVFYHHTYLSLYFNMAILFVIWIIHQVSKKQYYIYIIAGLLIVFFSLANYYLSSRIGIIVNILILIGWFSYSLFQFRYGKILLPVIFVIFYLSFPQALRRKWQYLFYCLIYPILVKYK